MQAGFCNHWNSARAKLWLLRIALRCGAVLLVVAAGTALRAHPVSLVSCEALVHRERIDLKIAVMPEDFLMVYGLSANSQSRIENADIVKSAEKHKAFLLSGLVIRDEDGNHLEGRVINLEMPELPAEGLLMADLMSTTIVYRLEYPLAKPPTHLTFQHRFGGDTIAIPAVVDLVVTREGLPPEPSVHIPGEEGVQTVAFDWNETSRPVTGNYAELKAREEEKRRQDMGIGSYSATYTFVYIQNQEVRVEILMPLMTLEMWQPVARSNVDFLEVSEQLAARATLETFFTWANEVKIDGIEVKPKLDRLDFYGVDFKDFAMRAEPRRLSAWTARVGAILSYATKGPPGHVDLKWTLFKNQMQSARTLIFAYDKGSRFVFSANQPIFRWDNPGAKPLPAVTSILKAEQSRATVAEALLRNIYRAFDYRNESDIYDALARSVQGDLLAELYLKIRQGLVMQEQGGAVAQVREVKVVRSEPAPENLKSGFAERVTWQVEGTVEHWGHIHTRVNEYSAELAIQAADGSWKITALNVARQSQVKSAVVLRKP
jgi:hypothetical protein